MKSWKTTGIGLLSAAAGFVAFSPESFGGQDSVMVAVCKYILAGGLAGLGIVAKDFDVTGRR